MKEKSVDRKTTTRERAIAEGARMEKESGAKDTTEEGAKTSLPIVSLPPKKERETQKGKE